MIKKHERLYGQCTRCGREYRKLAMYAVYIKPPHSANLKVLTHLCENCMADALEWLGTSEP